MTATTERTQQPEPANPAGGVRMSARVGWGDLAWVTWRQHRSGLLGIGLPVLGLSIAMLVLAGVASGAADTTYTGALGFSVVNASLLLTSLVIVYAALVGMFWAAPLLSREFEQRTHLFSWSQDVSAARWIAVKTVVLAGVVVLLALLLGGSAQILAGQLDTTASFFDEPLFIAAPLVQVGHALFGFALGLTMSLLTRRTVVSIGLTFGVLLVTRVVVGVFYRPYFQTPVRRTSSLEEGSGNLFPTEGYDEWYVGSGLLDRQGNAVDYPEACLISTGADSFDNCLRNNNIAGNYLDYQPVNRIGTFQLIEFGVFTALAGLLFLAVWRLVRRVNRL